MNTLETVTRAEHMMYPDGPQSKTQKKGATKRETWGWGHVGVPGAFMMLPKDSLKIDKSYQRNLSSKEKVTKVAREWDWMLCGTLVVVMRSNGDAVVVDGQHRAMAAAKRDDIDNLPCLVWEFDSLSREAQAFVGVNTSRSAVTSSDKFKAMCVAGDETALKTQAMLALAGYEHIGGSKVGKTLRCPLVLCGLMSSNEELTRKTFELAVAVADGEPLTQKIIRSIYWVGERDDELFKDLFRSRAVRYGVEGLTAAILRRELLTSSKGIRVQGEAVAELLNRGRQRHKLAGMG